MNDILKLHPIFASILLKNGITDPIDKIEIQGIEDEPGLHWSNPGLKKILLSVQDRSFSYVVKTLGEHSKREILVYRFLANKHNFPMPDLYHDVLKEDEKEYWIVIEECLSREFSASEAFWEQVGILLGSIHCQFWNRTDDLPEFFSITPKVAEMAQAFRIFSDFLESLNPEEKELLERDVMFSSDDMKKVLEGVDYNSILERTDTAKCLVHGAFHHPEIMWIKRENKYRPVGVDWEQARIGVPGEDLRIGADLLAEEDLRSFDTLFDTYLEIMNANRIEISRDELVTAARRKKLIHRMGNEIPWLLRQYLIVCEDIQFANWCQWVRNNMPNKLEFMKSEIKGDLLYKKILD